MYFLSEQLLNKINLVVYGETIHSNSLFISKPVTNELVLSDTCETASARKIHLVLCCVVNYYMLELGSILPSSLTLVFCGCPTCKYGLTFAIAVSGLP